MREEEGENAKARERQPNQEVQNSARKGDFNPGHAEGTSQAARGNLTRAGETVCDGRGIERLTSPQKEVLTRRRGEPLLNERQPGARPDARPPAEPRRSAHHLSTCRMRRSPSLDSRASVSPRSRLGALLAEIPWRRRAGRSDEGRVRAPACQAEGVERL